MFIYLRRRYTDKQIEDLNHLIKLRGKIRTVKWNRIFLRRCHERKVTPPEIKHRLIKAKVNTSWKMQLAFINDEIEKLDGVLERLRVAYRRDWSHCIKFLRFFDKLRLCNLFVKLENRMERKISTEHDTRIDGLVNKRYGSYSSEARTLINLSNYELTETEAFVLKLGLNFCVPTNSLSREGIAAEMEVMYTQAMKKLQPTSAENLKTFKAKLHDTAYAYAGSPIDKLDLPLRKEHFAAVRALRENQQILVTRPDKGTCTVVLDRSSYYRRIENEILSDTTKFVDLGPKNIVPFTKKIENPIRERLKELNDKRIIPEALYHTLRPVGSQIPRLYGLPKIHKENCPFRPILSMSNSPHERLAKWLLKCIKPAEDFYTKFCVKDSFSFAKEVHQMSNTLSHAVMTSFDVCSLFTNVPVKEAITITSNYLYEHDNHPNISQQVFEELMERVTIGVEFLFGRKVYKQIDGVAMGSPLGPALANIFLGYYEDILFRSVKPPLYYRRYVDDTFVMFESKSDASTFHDRLNELHASLQFTSETEVDGKLPFLDVLVTRQENQLITSVYRKKTYTGQYMQWNSFCPTQRKVGLIHTLTLRALSICSPCQIDRELNNIKSILLKNGYPEDIIDINIARRTKLFNSEKQYGPKLCPVYLTLPWIGSRSVQYQQILNRSIKSCFGPVALRVHFSTTPLMRFNLKDPLPATLRSMLVYEFKCFCEKKYVGKTERRIKDRISDHVPAPIRNGKIHNAPLPSSEKKTSSIAIHLCENRQCAEAYSEDRFRVIATARTSFHLSVLEAAYISSTKPILCRQTKFDYTLSVFNEV